MNTNLQANSGFSSTEIISENNKWQWMKRNAKVIFWTYGKIK
jgi:hypothetical protein